MNATERAQAIADWLNKHHEAACELTEDRSIPEGALMLETDGSCVGLLGIINTALGWPSVVVAVNVDKDRNPSSRFGVVDRSVHKCAEAAPDIQEVRP